MAGTFALTQVKKRDGRVVDFDESRIASAIYKAMDKVKRVSGVTEGDFENDSRRIADNVVRDLEQKSNGDTNFIPDIELIQNFVERNLILANRPETAKEYILYRHGRNQFREQKKIVPERVRKLAEESKKYFKDELGEFVYYRTYSRWMDDEGRRETWIETVDRYVNFMKSNLESKLNEDEYNEIRHSILNQKALPSMRLLWSAGKAAKSSNVTAYNCAYTTIEKLKDFSEILYILMCGTGVGFSVENQFIQQLPIIQKQKGEKLPAHVVEDSKEGWAKVLESGLNSWFSGYELDIDYSKLRPAGARLKTMGGRSSGPESLKVLMSYVHDKVMANQGRRLNSLDVHDIACKIGEIVVVGGVRRSAELSHSDLDDILMRDAKRGTFFMTHPERMMANNSAVYEEKPDNISFIKEWLALAESGSGERGIFNRGNLRDHLPKRRLLILGNHIYSMGTNPCGEIDLISKQFCNLSEAVARFDDTLETLKEKIKVATILGTYQASLTNFPYLSDKWKENCEKERLLGVSITGIMDAPILRNPEVLRTLRDYAVDVNKYYAERFGINQSTCVTCVKPSGSASKLAAAAAGGHARWSEEYIQHIRISANDPLFHMLKDQKYPYYPETGQDMSSATTYVIPFPVKSPDGSIFRKDLSAIDQLENWKRLKENYTEHNPSVSIYVGNDEWLETGRWVYNNWKSISGLAFFPKSDHVYQLAPYQEITNDKYNELVAKLPRIDFSQILFYERDDETSGSREYACAGGVCELV